MHRRNEITDTLRQRVISALHFGTLHSGDRLPSARTISAELRADPRVVTAVYRQLAREGLVERRPPSRAYFVAAGHAAAGGVAPAAEWLVDLVTESIARGVTAPEFPELARQSLETLRLRAACVECNADQIEWLRRELEEDYGVRASGVDIAALDGVDADGDRGALPPEVRSADLLVTTASHAGVVQPLAARLRTPCIVATVRPALVAELDRLLAAGPLFFVGTDPRYAAKLRDLYAGTDGAAHVRPVILGADEVEAIPDGAPTYVMRTARDVLGGVPRHVHALSTLRAFSAETSRAIVGFVVRANLAAVTARR